MSRHVGLEQPVSVQPAAPAPPVSAVPANNAPVNSAPANTTPAETAPNGFYPRDHRTGQPKVDTVIDAFMKQDVDRLMSLVWMREGKCAEGTDFYCGDKPPGTVRAYFAWASCQTNLLTETATIRDHMTRWVAEPRYLYAAYRVQGIGSFAYYVEFAKGLDDAAAKNAYLNADGQIVQLGMGCNVPQAMSADHYQPIAPPPAK